MIEKKDTFSKGESSASEVGEIRTKKTKLESASRGEINKNNNLEQREERPIRMNREGFVQKKREREQVADEGKRGGD